ncbi:ABC transporter ATP-binding protein [Neokomagataea thailandica]|uniref:Polysaccharide/polyol phosphate ABC transporter ATP-binding protein n=1 Tax=Neokomagataea tanensis NBRC 106556 TaxID=1223519 RepID=A0ABQ0QLN8_9PROT|nr:MULTISPECIES: ABC transporter ATP-binding protein [Neokomagataea]GBR49472.1 polysaccharide/polyol phosphate ABC transporter ATP-binding protein [Neokomagataea tanensis NBRC 106556]
MAFIHLKNVGVEFPIFNAQNRSLKNKVFNLATGGKIESREGKLTVVKSLEDISLDLVDGDRIGLIGHNGAGKTTLLRVFSGIYAPTSGECAIQGKCVSLINIQLGINYEETGRSNIKLRAAMMGMRPKQIEEKIEEIAEFSGLGHFLDMPFRTYSSGMQIRLAFATSTSIDPEILIMDEWLSAGDENFKEKANQRMSQLLDKTKILILASHSRELLERNCTKILWLEHGKVKMLGESSEVLDKYFSRS